jgi:hypothetical protein
LSSPGFESRTVTGCKRKADTFLWACVQEEAPAIRTLLRRKQLLLAGMTYKKNGFGISSQSAVCRDGELSSYHVVSTVIPRLTKIICPGITFVSRNLR